MTFAMPDGRTVSRDGRPVLPSPVDTPLGADRVPVVEAGEIDVEPLSTDALHSQVAEATRC